ncbi:Heat shock protein 75 kDa, mitochondrial [Frankliniella fusca]|uniref:Heat shock protein 75 kDa, mitochondrial n=1 Tax=Frankliniella fusca TaxID=407009 RepID=A0AAE1LKU1_9NEOP|nr:Heat shock protein 75 kDa, mitochondrial [Frankliniella fusca]
MAATLRFFAVSRLGQNLIRPSNRFRASISPKYLSLSKNSGIQWRQQFRSLSAQATEEKTPNASGPAEKLEFQAETRMLLDIVAKSLYSEKEVFIRELISNASDALEKLRHSLLADGKDPGTLEIRISTDKQNRILTIEDTGIGMTREELVSNLGTIARSGSKAFLEQMKEKGTDASSIIGQFGVGFYSAFMVADSVEVFTRSATAGTPGYKWSSDGSGTYEITEAENVEPGTKIVISLKADSREFSDEDKVKEIIKKYSNFVGSPIIVNGERANTIEPLWLKDPKEVSDNLHNEFYRFISNSLDFPRFWLHYKTDAPISIRALLYFPDSKPGLFEMSQSTDVGVALYTRKVLIKSKADNILPKWLRFVKGVVDSEDIPLNLSRELLQNSALIRKLRTVLTNRVLRFLHDRSQKEKESFNEFYKHYGLFLKEGIVTSHEQMEKEEISKLLRFESSSGQPGELVGIPEYCSRLKEGQKDIYYLAAPSRELAESSPYLEALRKKDVEVLFCYEPYDELVLMQLRQFDMKNIVSVEKEMRQSKEPEQSPFEAGSLSQTEVDDLIPWIKNTLKGKVHTVKVTNRLESHPCVVTVEEMAAARHFIRTQAHSIPQDSHYSILQPQLEINPKHPIIKKLSTLSKDNVKLAELVTNQLFSNAMVGAGLVEDPRTLLSSMNDLLTLALEKH